ncbi:hypothetical protein B296_00044732 [Ensete ventricosum]|uniref:Uncharacterized protein n=1 Tax=Ensete ventricosum TaxID=4639 RepID=A0A426X618_ENSVE|nr:hypothetical protein B296_00044732 [Ensete ventricosum]
MKNGSKRDFAKNGEGVRFRVRAAGFSLGRFSQGKVTAFLCARALLTLALAIGAGDNNLFPYRTMSGRGRTAVASAIDDSKRGRMAIASGISDFRHGRAATSSPLGAGRPLWRETVAAALRLVLGSLLLYDPTANQTWKGQRLLLQSAIQPDTALCFAYRSSVPAGCSSAGFFPAASAGCFIAECPSPAAAGSFTARGGCSSSVATGSSLAAAGYFTAGGGCSSLAADGSSPAA